MLAPPRNGSLKMAAGRCDRVRFRPDSREATHEENVRVTARGLVGGRTVKVPLFEVGDGRGGLVNGHGLATHATISVDPDVWHVSVRTLPSHALASLTFSLDLGALVESEVRRQEGRLLGSDEVGHDSGGMNENER